MISVFLAEVLDTEVINSESEGRATSGVAPKTWGVTDGVVSVWGEVGLELVVRQDGGFLETVHALSDFDVDVSF